jgi:hypothetical protein
MQTSIPSLNKQSQWMRPLQVLLLLTLLNLQVSCTLKINPVLYDHVYDFNLDDMDYKKTGSKMDFTKGTWTFIFNETLFEFAPEEPTMLIVSLTDCSQFIYLEKDKKVLVFDMDPENEYKPYVSETHKNLEVVEEDEMNYCEFYDSKRHTTEDMSNVLEYIFGENDTRKIDKEKLKGFKAKLKSIDFLPYYYLQRKKTGYKFKNKIEYFLNDDGNGLTKWGKEKGFLTDNWFEMIGEETHTNFKNIFVTRLMLSMFFTNMKFLTLNKLNEEETAKAMLFQESVMAKAVEIIKANDTPELQESFNHLITYFSDVAGHVLTYFYEQKKYPFFNDLFRPRYDDQNNNLINVSLNEHLDMRKSWRHTRMDYYTKESMENVYMLLENQEVKLQASMEEQEIQAKEALKNIADTLFDAMAEKVPDLGNITVESQTEFDQFLEAEFWKAKKKLPNCYKKAGKLKNEYNDKPFQTKFDASHKDQILESLNNSDFMIILKDYLQHFYIPSGMQAFEDRVIRNLSQFPVISKMNLNFSEDDDGRNALEVFREMLFTVDILKHKPFYYEDKVKVDAKRTVFTWADRRRMLLV